MTSLFSIFINDIDDGISSKIFKFADDTKIMRSVFTQEDINKLREDMRHMFKWSVDWQMLFNLQRCEVMHIGRKNHNAKYEMGGKELIEVKEEKDLGVIVSSDLKFGKQCAIAAKKGNQILGIIARTFENRSKKIILQLYKSLVRPHLDYCIQAWRPHLVKDIEALEKVQRRATRMIRDCKGMSCCDRLKKLNITTLETRRIRADLLEVFKIMKGLEGLRDDQFFEKHKGTTRGHSLKLLKKM